MTNPLLRDRDVDFVLYDVLDVTALTRLPYFAEHGSLGIGPDARSPAMLLVEEHPDRWDVRQILDDPEAEHAWAITAVVDLPASVEAGTAVVRIVDVAAP